MRRGAEVKGPGSAHGCQQDNEGPFLLQSSVFTASSRQVGGRWTKAAKTAEYLLVQTRLHMATEDWLLPSSSCHGGATLLWRKEGRVPAVPRAGSAPAAVGTALHPGGVPSLPCVPRAPVWAAPMGTDVLARVSSPGAPPNPGLSSQESCVLPHPPPPPSSLCRLPHPPLTLWSVLGPLPPQLSAALGSQAP